MVCGIFFILLGNYKLIRMIIKFSEKFHIIPNELYRQLLTFWTVKNKKHKKKKKLHDYALKVKMINRESAHCK